MADGMSVSDSTDLTRPWFLPPRPQTGTPTRAGVFPPAGAGCGQFGTLSRSLRGRLDVWAANLPGRQVRHSEPARTRYAPLVEELAEALPAACTGHEYVMLGYCSGALLAYGVLRQLARRGADVPL